ncbi:MAG: VOC family protein [Nocardioides sp.]|uniref:hypothetical protein n=1 Tax=Nocardioides sp. TaxID=35761 RepID=UPI0039E68B8E
MEERSFTKDGIMYDALVSADIVVSETDEAAALLVDLLGLPAPRPAAYLEPAGHGFRAVFLRLRPSLRVAPTQLELITPRPRTEPHDHVEERIVAQADRPVRTHATVLAGDTDAVLERLRTRGVRHRITEPSEDFPFPRIWIGVTAREPLAYDAGVDAGLWLEVVPSASAGIEPVAEPDVEASRGVRRIRARRFLVGDIDAAVQALARSMGLAPSAFSWEGGEAWATYTFGNASSAALELLRPAVGTAAGEFWERWGDGPHAIVFEAGDLDYLAGRLGEHGVAVERSVNLRGEKVLLADPSRTWNVPLEFVAATESA